MENENFKKQIQDLKNENILLKNRIKDQEETISNAKNIEKRTQKLATMGNMLINVAHQWKQPLNIISAVASSIRMSEFKDLKEEEIKESVDTIMNNVSHMAATTRLFMNFVRDDQEIREISVSQEVKEALELTKGMLQDNDINIISELENLTDIKTKALKGALVHALLNIINNAKDVLIERKVEKPEIKIECKKENGSINITIQDNAGGVKSANLENLFTPYYTTKDDDSGLGVGLSMSRDLIKEALNGQINVKNEEAGAMFIISFPIKK